ncbi:hypothetical protein LguiB_013950 [Lonicera macranthoides]
MEEVKYLLEKFGQWDLLHLYLEERGKCALGGHQVGHHDCEWNIIKCNESSDHPDWCIDRRSFDRKYGRSSNMGSLEYGRIPIDVRELAVTLMSDKYMDRKWEMISQVWAEMMCYVASKSKYETRLQELMRGGEFISQVWLLLLLIHGLVEKSPANFLRLLTTNPTLQLNGRAGSDAEPINLAGEEFIGNGSGMSSPLFACAMAECQLGINGACNLGENEGAKKEEKDDENGAPLGDTIEQSGGGGDGGRASYWHILRPKFSPSDMGRTVVECVTQVVKVVGRVASLDGAGGAGDRIPLPMSKYDDDGSAVFMQNFMYIDFLLNSLAFKAML